MRVNRVSRFQWRDTASYSAAETAREDAAPQSFVVCQGLFAGAVGNSGWNWQNELFRIAYENARAHRASPERSSCYERLFSNWN